jgi:hypothetical protein
MRLGTPGTTRGADQAGHISEILCAHIPLAQQRQLKKTPVRLRLRPVYATGQVRMSWHTHRQAKAER